MHVALLYNAPSLPPDHADFAQEAGVLESVEAVEAALAILGHSSQRMAVGPDPVAMAVELRGTKAGVLVNLFEGLHGTGAGESQVAGLLELIGVPFTGTGSDGLALVAVEPSALVAAVHEHAALAWVQDNTPELAGDSAARRELRVRIAAVRQQMDNALAEDPRLNRADDATMPLVLLWQGAGAFVPAQIK